MIMNKIAQLFQKIKQFLGFVSPKEEKPEKAGEVQETAIPQHLQATISPQPGIPCPKCGYKIQVSIPLLLSGESVTCPSCLLQLNVDKNKSSESLAALNKLQEGMEKAGKMGRNLPN